jgi:hypothetical protein
MGIKAQWRRCPNGHTSWHHTHGSVQGTLEHNYRCDRCGVRFDHLERAESDVGADGRVLLPSMDELREEYAES